MSLVLPFLALVVAVGIVAAIWVVGLYNGFVTGRNRVKNAWSQIDVQLKRRYDLIPNLVETAKGYLKHESETLEKVTRARQIAIDASTVKDQIAAENVLTSTLRSLMAVSENYPDLKANTNMLAIQEELSSTENRIGFARQHYNDQVMEYNTGLQKFPGNVIAGMFQFQQEPFFEVTDAEERKAPAVKF